MAAFRQDEIARLRRQVGQGRVICGLSGGVDSSVVAVLLHEALGELRGPDIAEALRELPPDAAAKVMASLPFDLAVAVFDEPELTGHRCAIIQRIEPRKVGPPSRKTSLIAGDFSVGFAKMSPSTSRAMVPILRKLER